MQRENKNTNQNKKQYRDHWDVMAAILETLHKTNGEGAGITYLVFSAEYKAWSPLLSLLDELLDKGMIAMKAMPAIRPDLKRHKIFFITPKGIKFLYLYQKLKEFLKG